LPAPSPAAAPPAGLAGPAGGPPANPSEPATGGGERAASEAHLRRAENDALGADAKKLKDDSGGEGPLAARADFRSAIWWSPTVRVGADGTADLGLVKFAESLTRWRITARAVDAQTRVGSSVATVRTAKKVLTRVTLP